MIETVLYVLKGSTIATFPSYFIERYLRQRVSHPQIACSPGHSRTQKRNTIDKATT